MCELVDLLNLGVVITSLTFICSSFHELQCGFSVVTQAAQAVNLFWFSSPFLFLKSNQNLNKDHHTDRVCV